MIGYRLSRTGVAGHPFYISSLGIGLWSVEELCYFLYENPALIDESVVGGSLTRWLTEEFHMNSTVLVMERSMKNGAGMGEILLPLFRAAGYLEPFEIRSFQKRLQTMASGGAPLQLKMMGDALARNRKYGEAVSVYSQAEENTRKGETKLLASILHNRGYALMQLLHYEEAYRAFRRAFALEETPKRKRDCLLAAALAKPREVFYDEAEELEAGKEMIREVLDTVDSFAVPPVTPPADLLKELQRIRQEYHSEAGN